MNFTKLTTADEVLTAVDLSGQTMIVTGASGGIGAETARVLAVHGASVVLAARDLAKAEGIANGIEAIAPTGAVQILPVDLSSLASVRSFTDAFLDEHDRLDALIANAAVMATPFELTADGFELRFGTNHLGHFVQVNRLVPALVAAAPSQVVVLSSAAHRWSDVDLDDPSFTTTPSDKYLAYARAANGVVRCARSPVAPARCASLCCAPRCHPHRSRPILDRRVRSRIDEMAKQGGTRWKTVEQGAATSVWAATSDEHGGRGGVYLEDCDVAAVTAPRSTVSDRSPSTSIEPTSCGSCRSAWSASTSPGMPATWLRDVRSSASDMTRPRSLSGTT